MSAKTPPAAGRATGPEQDAEKEVSTLSGLAPPVQALALLVAVAMPAEYMTNVRGRHLPRPSRVLLHFGCTMPVATAVTWSVCSRASPFGGSFQFDGDAGPQLGIRLMGAPPLLTLFSFALAEWRRGGIRSGELVAAQDEVEDAAR